MRLKSTEVSAETESNGVLRLVFQCKLAREEQLKVHGF